MDSLNKLRAVHSDLLATASDLELNVPDRLVVEFFDARVGQKLCKELHALIEKGRHTVRPKQKEATVAKKAKKAAKKAKTAKTAKKKATGRGFPEDAKIKVLVSENPLRKGTGRFERVAKMLKSGGKTIAASGVATSTLRYGVEQSLISVG